MKNVLLLIRVILFVALLAALAYLGLELKKKWDREARQAAEPPAAVETPS